MRDFVNATAYDNANKLAVKKGIIKPVHRIFHAGTDIYRFGNDRDTALLGAWWLEHSQLMLVKQWAVVHGLALPYAVRVLCAIAHRYGDMRVWVKAKVISPLHGFEGQSRKQLLSRESINTELSQSSPPIRQAYIPGLWDKGINRASLMRFTFEEFDIGASHIGGVPLFPENAVIQ